MIGREEYIIRSGCLKEGKCGYENDLAKTQYKELKSAMRGRDRNSPNNPQRLKHLAEHRRRIVEPYIKKAVDNNEPIEPAASLLVNQSRFNRRLQMMAQIEKENADLFMRIKYAKSSDGGTIDKRVASKLSRVGLRDRTRQIKAFKETYENCLLYRRLANVKGVVCRKEQLEWFKKQQSIYLLRTKYIPFWAANACAPYQKYAYLKSLEKPRPIVYMDFEVTDRSVGRVIFELRADVCPVTAENFRSLCAGDGGISYRYHHLDRVFPGLFWRGASKSPYGGTFPTENFKIEHSKAGVLSMVGYGVETHNTEFMISGKALPSMDKENIAFGHIIEGLEYLQELSKTCKPFESGRPRFTVVITNCGETTRAEMEKLRPPILNKDLRRKVKMSLGIVDDDDAAPVLPQDEELRFEFIHHTKKVSLGGSSQGAESLAGRTRAHATHKVFTRETAGLDKKRPGPAKPKRNTAMVAGRSNYSTNKTKSAQAQK